MSRLESTLKKLSSGTFICETHYGDEYEFLKDRENFHKVEEWVSAAGYRLARLSDEGAFFLAHGIVTHELRSKLREEMRQVRNKLEPFVGFMETIRQAQGRHPQIHPGDMIFLSELSEIVRGSSMLDRRLQDMREISGSRTGESTQDRIQKMLNQLEDEGYIFESNATHKGYCVTGKIEHLYKLIGFIAVNTKHISDDDVIDQIDQQASLNIERPDYAADKGGTVS
jgi:biotin operon repressor